MPIKRIALLSVIFVCLLIVASLINRRSSLPVPTSIAPTKTSIRIGWQTPWATQGQLVQILKHTDILQREGLQPEFKGFSYGGPLNEAAMANLVDVILTADQPMATLLSKNPHWVIVGRLMYNRVSLYVPPNSPIKSIADLKGKTVAMPVGAAAQRFALLSEQQFGLSPEKDVKNINLAMEEQAALLQDPQATKWGEIDALAGFDPSPAIFEERGVIRTLAVGKVVSVIAVSQEYADAHPKIAEQLRTAFAEAYAQHKTDPRQANQWFRDESALTVSDASLSLAASLEPNLSPTSTVGIRMSFTEDDLSSLQEAADFLKSQGLIKQEVVMKNHVDPEAIE
jgi:ABC-type nitrate/sulfonate/bicarbonate transport system substrate-binding protein